MAVNDTDPDRREQHSRRRRGQYDEIALIRLDRSLALDPSLRLSVSVLEPASLVLLAFGGLAATGRRRA